MFVVLIPVGVLASAYFLCWLSWLIFLILLARTHGPKALRDAAVAARAFPGNALAAGIARALRPR